MPNAFRILKPIQKSSKRVWVFRNTGANAFAKNQMRLAYEDKRDLYCMKINVICTVLGTLSVIEAICEMMWPGLQAYITPLVLLLLVKYIHLLW